MSRGLREQRDPRRRRPPFPNRIPLAARSALLLLTTFLGGCSPTYVLRAGLEEIRILWRREPIEHLLKGDLPPEERAKLELTLALRAFARDRLGLSVGGSYTSLARIDEGQIVHVVTAAPWNRLELKTWWFPIVGHVPYRGYFSRDRAASFAAALRRDGYDARVRRAVAFSTLGWFDDPLLTTVLRLDPPELASVVIHELLHNTVYLPSQAAFNESFATFVGRQGAIAFFKERQDRTTVSALQDAFLDELAFSDFLEIWLARLGDAYATGIDRSERTRLFEAMQADFRSRDWRTNAWDGFAAGELDNAVLLHQWLYVRRLRSFAAVLDCHAGDLPATIRWIITAARNADDPFEALGPGCRSSGHARPVPAGAS